MSLITRAKAIDILSEFEVGRIVKKLEIGDFTDIVHLFKFGVTGLVDKTNNELSLHLETHTTIKYKVIDE